MKPEVEPHDHRCESCGVPLDCFKPHEDSTEPCPEPTHEPSLCDPCYLIVLKEAEGDHHGETVFNLTKKYGGDPGFGPG